MRPHSSSMTLTRQPRGIPAGSAFTALLLFVLWTFPVVGGWSAGHVIGWAAFSALFVLLPGFACLSFLDRERDALSALFLAFVAGLASLALVFVGLGAIGARPLVWGLPVVSACAWWAAHRRRPRTPRRATTRSEAVAVCVLVAAVLLRVTSESAADWFKGFESDASFHVENAAELRWHWPMADPRIVGESMRYHFLGYVPSAAASVVLGLPVRECMLGLGPHFLPVMFALGVFSCARSLRAGPWTAAFAALALVLHVDIGTYVGNLFGRNTSFDSNFDVGLYSSITTAQGMCVWAAILLVLRELLEDEEPKRGRMILLGAFAVLASGSKGSVLPPLVAGMGTIWIWGRLSGKALPRAFLRALVVIVVAWVPFTLWLALDSGGYAQSMFKWHPGAAAAVSPLQRTVVMTLGGDPNEPSAWATALLFAPWLLGYLGIGALALWTWIATRSRPVSAFETLLATTVMCALAPAVLLVAQGSSQMFFAYDAQVCAVLLGAAASTRLAPPSLRTFMIAAGAILLAQLAAVVWTKATDRRLAYEFVGDLGRYRAGLDWVRSKTPSDAVFLIDDPRLCAASWSERRAFFETSRFAPRLHAQFEIEGGRAKLVGTGPFLEHERVQRAFFAHPTAEGVRAVRAIVGAGVPIFALRSNLVVTPTQRSYRCELRPVENAGTFGGDAGVTLVHDGTIVTVHRLPDG